MKILDEWKLENGKYECPYCKKHFVKKGIGYHIWKNHGDGQTFVPFENFNKKGKKAWNKGLNKETNDNVKKISETLKRRRRNGELEYRHTEEFKISQRKRAIDQKLGGVTQSKIIEYKGKILGSSYELIVAKDLDRNNILWDVCNRIGYIDPFGKKRTYTPDFYLPEFNVYLDPKNDFLIENINPRLGFKDIDKIRCVEDQHNIKILILNKTQLSWKEIKNLIDASFA